MADQLRKEHYLRLKLYRWRDKMYFSTSLIFHLSHCRIIVFINLSTCFLDTFLPHLHSLKRRLRVIRRTQKKSSSIIVFIIIIIYQFISKHPSTFIHLLSIMLMNNKEFFSHLQYHVSTNVFTINYEFEK